MPTNSTILGHATTYHDPALAIISGDYVFAEAIERHTQCKRAQSLRAFHYSSRAVRAALSRAAAPLSRDVVVRTTWPVYADFSVQPSNAVFARMLKADSHWMEQAEPVIIHELLAMVGGKTFAQSRQVEIKPTAHHLCHAANAVYTSPFEECVVMIADGTGDAGWLTFYHYDGTSFRQLAPAGNIDGSLGTLYERVTNLCGFNALEGEEWKVMGLAAYGERDPKIFDFFRTRSRVDGLRFELDFPAMDDEWIKDLAGIVGSFRRHDEPGIVERSAPLAKSFQDYFESVVIELAANANKLGLSRNLAYSGGCALNSSCNGKIIEGSGFARLHVCSAPADDGNALGAALYEHHYVRKAPRQLQTMSPYLGSEISEDEADKIFSFAQRGWRTHIADSDAELCERVASMLVEGKIVAWCQGRAEFGPRALGNRSIIADPRSPTMKDAINSRVKFREEYRPLAPSILDEHGDAYFENYQFSPYMERTLRFRPEVRTRVPAVVHLDGTGRVQSVTRELNPLYYDLINAFRAKTSVPLILNTSFNVMGKPIVHSAADAMTVFVTTDLDVLVIGRRIVSKY
jgi:carbamoyltransferase